MQHLPAGLCRGVGTKQSEKQSFIPFIYCFAPACIDSYVITYDPLAEFGGACICIDPARIVANSERCVYKQQQANLAQYAFKFGYLSITFR